MQVNAPSLQAENVALTKNLVYFDLALLVHEVYNIAPERTVFGKNLCQLG